MKKIGLYVWCLVGVLWLLSMRINATEQEIIGVNILLEVTETVAIYEEPASDAKVVTTIEAGTPIISASVQQDAWIEVSYQQIKGFIEVKNVKIFGEAGLEAEFEEIEQANRLLMTELQYIEKEQKAKFAWGIVIAVLVIAIFTIGIVSGMLKNLEEKKKARTVYKHQKRSTKKS